MERTTAKAYTYIYFYSRLVNGDTLSKQELALSPSRQNRQEKG